MSRPIQPTLAERKTPGEILGYASADEIRDDLLWLVQNGARVIFHPDATVSATIGAFSRRRETLLRAVDELRNALREPVKARRALPTTHSKEPK